jgi:xylulokinase
MVRDGINGSSTKSWDSFNKAVQETPAPKLESKEKDVFGFYFRDHEIIPRNVQGLYRFDAELDMKSEPLNLKSLDAVHWSTSDAKRILESQFLSFKSKINQLLPADSPSLRRIYVTGGASANPVITSLLSTVLNAPIYAGGSAQGCAMGGAYRAAWCHASKQGGDVEFAEFVKNSRNAKETVEAEGRVVAQPDRDLAKVYDDLLESWRKAEAQVIQACAK